VRFAAQKRTLHNSIERPIKYPIKHPIKHPIANSIKHPIANPTVSHPHQKAGLYLIDKSPAF
jgi:hypothetical protein